VHIEVEPGNVIVVPAWILDPVACGEMRVGDPVVALEALSDLGELLVALEFRSSSRGGDRAGEDSHEATET